MSRFDDELIKQADNAFQQHGLSGQTTTPRQQPYDQTSNLNLDGPFGLSSQAPAPINETADWVAERPMSRQLEVRDLDAADAGEIVGGPGNSAVYPEGQPMYASKNPIEESLYNVYKASREIRDSIDGQIDFDFSNLFTASSEAATVLRFASSDDQTTQIVGTVASIVSDIESDLENTGDYRQASADLVQLEELLQDINKHAAYKESMGFKTYMPAGQTHPMESVRNLGYSHTNNAFPGDDTPSMRAGRVADHTKAAQEHREAGHHEAADAHVGAAAIAADPNSSHQSIQDATEKAIDYSHRAVGSKGTEIWTPDRTLNHKASKEATNGNQETNVVVDVRDLDDQAGVWDRDRVMAPDHQTNVLVPEEVNGEDAGYVPFYNDGSETGIIPQNGPHHQEVWPMDGTNPAYAPYAGTVAAVQSSRERIFEAMQVVERLEKLGMVQNDDRAKHIAKFEQMSDSKLAGFKASLDMLEESGARQPRSQKVASGSNRLPEMGRLTTASKVARQDVQSDDWLMTL
jgi:hypothetical protein